ncbi:alpha/beta hydrolase [Streptomyces chrestomyceticus JCM 4735]|uniref:Alpha/beta hydrolase n=1 Tax=Streptomyces chrestomyceticus JCM 4735 TaxID=1306181 RepID=A0A7U9L112_9ACTN|nr:alpha/beta hydrolase [Streptomyces chrestomyceticus]GCD38432.1 alpha/beta hydrolase [Streptomyces chrestomyceticus JCM 4735]
MQLHTQEWGTGDRVAVLVHGIMSDHRTWRRVGPALAARGYRVIAVDLRGHGASPRGPYSDELFADDLVETLPSGVEVALGHSLGAVALSLAAERLRPRRAVYSDPAWTLGNTERPMDPALFVEFKRATHQMIRSFNPRWEEADVEIEMATIEVWDPDTALALSGNDLRERIPERPVVPSLVQVAGEGFLFSEADKERVAARGFEVRTVEGAGHTIHRDDFDGFMKSLDGWI